MWGEDQQDELRDYERLTEKRGGVHHATSRSPYSSGAIPFLRSSSRALSVFFRPPRPIPFRTCRALVNWTSPYSTTCQRLPQGSRKSRPLPGNISTSASLSARRTAF